VVIYSAVDAARLPKLIEQHGTEDHLLAKRRIRVGWWR
jgi:hypothetical protein